ncbi:proton-translocating NADH-quinone oxidoreductase, chain M [Oscillochloris trichoides DG-6]|uniref:Proton-translocating NADH-quinone oxidoreductase, chain M n=1 Tax=Oscillochloris trichoides DG-6 TaxID=765420 RepID=E1IHS2_9CHLR|nr:NADH-quinone oxidoreductase subunit M [Oscillochloris trichoides]EFO79259.1 proton-translocating NADH-quinone oxidoreductase, chain M [Oscillochloris trichoides DG-6]
MGLITISTDIPWLSLIWLSLLVPSVLIAFIPDTQQQLMRIVGTGFAFISLVLSLLIFFAYDPKVAGFQFVERLDWIPQIGITYLLGVDGISLAMLVLNGVVIFTGSLMSWNIESRAKEYWIWLLLLTTGVYGVFVSLDLFLFFVFYELAVLPMYLLIGIWGSTRKEYGAMKLTLFLMAGSAMAIIGMLGIYFQTGLRTFDMIALARNVTMSAEYQRIFFPLLFLGFAVLSGMFPFHTWSPTGHVAAPTAVSMLHAGVLMKLGAYGCLRAAMWLMPEGARDWLPIMAVLTILNVVYGATIAMAQRDAKFIIGYSSVSHMGLVMMALASGTQIGLLGAVLQMFAHGIMTALFFSVVGRMIYERTHTRQLPELGGLGRVMPFAAVMFILGGLSSMGMPGFAGFWAEFAIFIGVWERYPLIAVIAALSIPITGAYILRAVYSVFFDEVKNPEFLNLPKLTWQEYSGALILASILILVGIYPGFLTDMINMGVAPIAQQLNDVIVAGR